MNRFSTGFKPDFHRDPDAGIPEVPIRNDFPVEAYTVPELWPDKSDPGEASPGPHS